MTYDVCYYYYNFVLTLYIIWVIEYPCDGSTSWIFTVNIYKPFMLSLRRPTVACLLFIYFISPLCGVAQTPDCGMLLIIYSYKPFMWRRSDVRLRHALIYYPFEASLQTLGRCILFLLPYYIFIFYMNNLHACILDFVYFVTDVMIIEYFFVTWLPLIYYTRVLDVREYIQTYSLACPWLLSWPDPLLGDKHRHDSPGTYAMVIAASRR